VAGSWFSWFIWFVWFLWFVWFRERNKPDQPDKLDKLPGVVPRRSSEPFTIHHSTLNIEHSYPHPLPSHSDGPARPEKAECPRFRSASASACTIGTTRPVKRRNRTSSSTSRCSIIGYVVTPRSATIPRPSSKRGRLWLNQVLGKDRYKASYLRKATAANIVTRET